MGNKRTPYPVHRLALVIVQVSIVLQGFIVLATDTNGPAGSDLQVLTGAQCHPQQSPSPSSSQMIQDNNHNTSPHGRRPEHGHYLG